MRGQRVRWAGWLGVALLLGVLTPAILTPAAAQDSGGRICAAAFHDANRNGLRDAIEPLLADVVVSLYNDQGVIIASYVTNGQAEPYCFAGLGAGTYTVGFAGALVEATGQETFALTLTAGQVVPAQAQFGAVPIDPATLTGGAAAVPASSGSNNTLTLRLVLAFGGAGAIMALLAAVGVLIYWVRYRRAPGQSAR